VGKRQLITLLKLEIKGESKARDKRSKKALFFLLLHQSREYPLRGYSLLW